MAEFNSREYEWNDIRVNVGGRDIVGLLAVSYTESQEKEVVYARGNKPLRVQRGNKSYKGEITILQSELEALKIGSGKNSLLDINFNITIGYVPADNLVIVTDQCKGCEFTEIEKGMKQGDKNAEIKLPFIFIDLKSNI